MRETPGIATLLRFDNNVAEDQHRIKGRLAHGRGAWSRCTYLVTSVRSLLNHPESLLHSVFRSFSFYCQVNNIKRKINIERADRCIERHELRDMALSADDGIELRQY
jgi:hypothetical protein